MKAAGRTAVAMLFGTASFCASSAAMAESYRLEWVREPGAESCISGAALARLLEQVLGPSAVDSGPPLLAQGHIAPAPAPLRWRMTLRVWDARGELLGERELSHAAPHCSALTSSVLLILAMSIDPDAARSGLPPAVAAELRRDRNEDVDVWPSAVHVPPIASFERLGDTLDQATPNAGPRRAAPAETARPTPRWQVLFGLALSIGLLPEVSPGLSLAGRFRFAPAWSVSLGASAWLPRQVPLPGPYALADGVEFGALQAELRLCRSLVDGRRFELSACLGSAVGSRWVSAAALETRQNPWRAYLGPMLGLESKVQLGQRGFVSGGVTAIGQLRQDRFTYLDHAGEVRPLFTPSSFAGWASLNIGAEL